MPLWAALIEQNGRRGKKRRREKEEEVEEEEREGEERHKVERRMRREKSRKNWKGKREQIHSKYIVYVCKIPPQNKYYIKNCLPYVKNYRHVIK